MSHGYFEDFVPASSGWVNLFRRDFREPRPVNSDSGKSWRITPAVSIALSCGRHGNAAELKSWAKSTKKTSH